MPKDIDTSIAGSLTLAILIGAVVFLLRNFYKRFNNIDRTDDSSGE